MKIFFAAVVTAAVATAAAPNGPAPLRYDITKVTRTLMLERGDAERELSPGDHAVSGDRLRTGSRSRAELTVQERAARFVIGAKTRFRLAHERPGVLLEVERGGVHGIFDPLPDGDHRERLVTTPSAVLAVRGTEYGVEVEKDGDTTVVVFEGTVEVRDADGIGESVRVGAGQAVRVRRGRAAGRPEPHGLSSGDWDRGRRVRVTAPGGPDMPGDPGGRPGMGPPSSPSQGGSRRHGG
jgi:ferric-dicitrate binding protein FerR (iron transport regulator)